MKYKKEVSLSMKLRNKWLKKGIDLINITTLCDVKLGDSGWCNDFNEPNETIHHIQIWYRDEPIANAHADGIIILDDDKYLLHSEEDPVGNDFIIYRKVKIV